MKKIKKIAALFGAGATVIAGKKLYDKYKYKNLSQKKEIQIPHRQGFYEKYIKRPQDFCCALVATIVLSPVMGGQVLIYQVLLT